MAETVAEIQSIDNLARGRPIPITEVNLLSGDHDYCRLIRDQQFVSLIRQKPQFDSLSLNSPPN